MPTLVLTTPSIPGNADWTDSTLIPTAPSGPAGGDLNGTYPNPSVDGLQTRPVSPAAPAINDSLVWNGAAWIPLAVGAGAITAVYGQFTSNVDQPLVANTNTIVTYNQVAGANGVSVVAGSQITVAQAGVYEFGISLQMLHTGGTPITVIFWLLKNGTRVPDSASSLEMGNNNNRTIPFVPIILSMNAGDQVEWAVRSSGNNTSVEHFNEDVPNAIPAIPSVIASVKRLGS